MILQGKYWLASNEAMTQQSYTDFSVSAPFTVYPYNDGEQYNCSSIRIVSYISSWSVVYYASSSIFEDENPFIYVLQRNTLKEVKYQYGTYSRIIDFGEEPKTVALTEAQESIFNSLFTAMPSDEYTNEPILAQVTNKILNNIRTEALDKIEKCKPTLVSTSTHDSWDQYDIVFFRAKPHSSYTPVCYAIPAKLMCEAVKPTGNFKIQVADNASYSVFICDYYYGYDVDDPSGHVPFGVYYSEGNNGQMQQVYGLKFPTEVKD